MLLKFKKAFNIKNIKDLNSSIIEKDNLLQLSQELTSFPERYFSKDFFALYCYSIKDGNKFYLLFIKESNKHIFMDWNKSYSYLYKDFISQSDEEEKDILESQMDSLFEDILSLTSYKANLNLSMVKLLNSKSYKSVPTSFSV